MSDSIIDRQALIDAFECLDLIDRQATTKSLVRPRVIDPYDQYWTGRNDQYDADVFALKDLPSAEPERKKGHWLKGDEMPDYPRVPYKSWKTYCSECRSEILFESEPDFCPWCGADMRGGEK